MPCHLPLGGLLREYGGSNTTALAEPGCCRASQSSASACSAGAAALASSVLTVRVLCRQLGPDAQQRQAQSAQHADRVRRAEQLLGLAGEPGRLGVQLALAAAPGHLFHVGPGRTEVEDLGPCLIEAELPAQAYSFHWCLFLSGADLVPFSVWSISCAVVDDQGRALGGRPALAVRNRSGPRCTG